MESIVHRVLLDGSAAHNLRMEGREGSALSVDFCLRGTTWLVAASLARKWAQEGFVERLDGLGVDFNISSLSGGPCVNEIDEPVWPQVEWVDSSADAPSVEGSPPVGGEEEEVGDGSVGFPDHSSTSAKRIS